LVKKGFFIIISTIYNPRQFNELQKACFSAGNLLAWSPKLWIFYKKQSLTLL